MSNDPELVRLLHAQGVSRETIAICTEFTARQIDKVLDASAEHPGGARPDPAHQAPVRDADATMSGNGGEAAPLQDHERCRFSIGRGIHFERCAEQRQPGTNFCSHHQ